LRAAGIEAIDFRMDGAVGPGKLRALRRMTWLNVRLAGLIRARGLDTYLSFSHFLPWTLPRDVLRVIGVANLAPFSAEAVAAEVNVLPRLRLAVLRRTIVSSARRADRVIALSRACRDILVRHGVAESRIAVIPNGVESPLPFHDEHGDAIRARLGIGGEFLLYVSHFYRYKNFERLVEAYRGLPAELARRHPLVLVGRPYDRRYHDEIAVRCRTLPESHRATIVPGLEPAELRALYAACSLFVYPSLVENSPNILLEAMANGAPVLAGDVPPMSEFGRSAAGYFDPLSVESLRGAMAALLADPAGRQRMRGASRAEAARYSWDAFTAGVVTLYRGAGDAHHDGSGIP
jgi:glycosyltransferase involved in cell wall biosynthesis